MFLKNVSLVRLTSWFVLLVFDQFDLTTLNEKLVFFVFMYSYRFVHESVRWSHCLKHHPQKVMIILPCQLLVFPWWNVVLTPLSHCWPGWSSRVQCSGFMDLHLTCFSEHFVKSKPCLQSDTSRHHENSWDEGISETSKKLRFLPQKGLNCWRNTLLVVSYF